MLYAKHVTTSQAQVIINSNVTKLWLIVVLIITIKD